jgi:single stranded DNA-binding protein
MNRIPFKNHVHISGFIGNDPQVRFLPAGDAVMSLRIATKHFWKNAAGEWKSATEWHTAVLYRQLAQLAEECLFKKGDFIDLEGRVHTREWLDDHQHKHVSREIIAERFHRVDLPIIPKAADQSEQQGLEDRPSGSNYESQSSESLEAFKKLT